MSKEFNISRGTDVTEYSGVTQRMVGNSGGNVVGGSEVSQATFLPSFSGDLLGNGVGFGEGGLTSPVIGDTNRNRLTLDHEGIWRECKAEEQRQYGARRGANLIPSAQGSELLSVGGNKTVTVEAGTYVYSQGFGTGTAVFSGTAGATGTLTADFANRTSTAFTLSAGTFIVTGSVADIIAVQLEETSGSSKPNIPGPYLSTGVLSSPFQGFNADGVQYFLTENANTVLNNVITERLGNPISQDIWKGLFCEGEATEISGRSADINNWTDGTSATVVQNQIGLLSRENEAFTLTDSLGIVANRLLNTAILNDSLTRYMIVRVAYNASPLVYPRLRFFNNGGVAVIQSIVFDPSNGNIVVVEGGGISENLGRHGDFWFVLLSVTNNSSGNANAGMQLEPAYNTDGTAIADGAAQGSTVFAASELYESVWSWSPLLTTGGISKTRLSDTGYTVGIPNWPNPDSEISWDFECTPFFDEQLLTPEGITTPNSAVIDLGSYFSDTGIGDIDLSDGTTKLTLSGAFSTVGETFRLKARAGSMTMNFSVDQVSAAGAAYDTSFNATTSIGIGIGLEQGFALKNWSIYDTDLTNNWLVT